MMNARSRFGVGAASALAIALALPFAAPAQEKYPEWPVRLVVPFSPGGQNDLVGRMWAQHVTPILGQVIVENRGGAGGTIGSAEVARSKNDGYTLLLGNTTTVVINPVAMVKPTYGPEDLAPIAVITLVPTSICIHPSLPVKNLKELIAFAKKHPGKLSYGSAGTGSITNLTGELFKIQGGDLDIVHIPYKGAGPGLTDLIAGHIPVYTPILSAAPLQYHKTGRLRMLAINSEKRVPAAPDVPTAREAGMPDMIVQNFNAVLAPDGTPRAIIDQLNAVTLKVLSDAGFQGQLRKVGAEPVTDSSPEKAARFVQSEIKRWAPIIKRTGFTIN